MTTNVTYIYENSLIAVPVNVTPPYGVVPTAFSVQFAFLSTDPPEPQPSTWFSGQWSTNQNNPPPYQATCLVGPGGATQLAIGTYSVWIQINSTGTGELPVLLAGTLYVQ